MRLGGWTRRHGGWTKLQKPFLDSPNRFQKLPDDSRNSWKLPEARKIDFSIVFEWFSEFQPPPTHPPTPSGPPPPVASGDKGGFAPTTTRREIEAKRNGTSENGKRKKTAHADRSADFHERLFLIQGSSGTFQASDIYFLNRNIYVYKMFFFVSAS